MKQDKWSKEFRPGSIQIEKRDREDRKRRGLAKKAKKLNVVHPINQTESATDAWFRTMWWLKLPHEPRALTEMVEELDALMETHQRLMGHFGLA